MGNPAGVRRDFDALEKRRRYAVQLVTVENLTQKEVSRRLNVARQTVGRWIRDYADRGEEALAKAGRAGRKPLLMSEQRERIIELLQEGPRRLGYGTSVWTCSRVAHLIEKEFGIRYHAGHIWKLLASLGWPLRARRRNDEQSPQQKRKKLSAIEELPSENRGRSATRVE